LLGQSIAAAFAALPANAITSITGAAEGVITVPASSRGIVITALSPVSVFGAGSVESVLGGAGGLDFTASSISPGAPTPSRSVSDQPTM
jgi:hypothetical protein